MVGCQRAAYRAGDRATWQAEGILDGGDKQREAVAHEHDRWRSSTCLHRLERQTARYAIEQPPAAEHTMPHAVVSGDWAHWMPWGLVGGRAL